MSPFLAVLIKLVCTFTGFNWVNNTHFIKHYSELDSEYVLVLFVTYA